MSKQELKQAFEALDTSSWCKMYLWLETSYWKEADIDIKWQIFYGVTENEDQTICNNCKGSCKIE